MATLGCIAGFPRGFGVAIGVVLMALFAAFAFSISFADISSMLLECGLCALALVGCLMLRDRSAIKSEKRTSRTLLNKRPQTSSVSDAMCGNGDVNTPKSPKSAQGDIGAPKLPKTPQTPGEWKKLVFGLVKNQNWSSALQKLRTMHDTGVTDISIYHVVLDGMAKSGFMKEAEALMKELSKRGIPPNVFCYSSLISGYAQLKDVEGAERWHAAVVASGLELSIYCFSPMIHACAKANNLEAALVWLERMEASGLRPETVVFSSLLNACANAVDLGKALEVFRRMKASGVELNSFSYSSLGKLFMYKGRYRVLEELFAEMLANGIALTSCCLGLLLACYKNARPKQPERAIQVTKWAVATGVVMNDRIWSILKKLLSAHQLQELQDELHEIASAGVGKFSAIPEFLTRPESP